MKKTSILVGGSISAAASMLSSCGEKEGTCDGFRRNISKRVPLLLLNIE